MQDNDTEPRPKPLRIIISTVLLIALAGAAYVALNGMPVIAAADDPAETASEEPSDEGQSIQAPASVPVPVVTADADRREMIMKITATGNAEATRQLELQTASTGDVLSVDVVEGQIVEAGDPIARLDDTELRLEVGKAREALVKAIANFSGDLTYLKDYGGDDPSEMEARAFSSLLEADDFAAFINDPEFDELFNTITREEVIAARDNLVTQRANFEQAELNLARAQILAPFGGQIAELEVVVGQRLSPDTKVATLVDASPIRVRVEVLESDAGLARVGRRAEVHFAAYPGETFVGVVEAISPLVDPEERTLEVLVSLPNDGLRLKPGMFAQITLDTQIFDDRLLVPADAVLLRSDRPMVFRVINGRSDWVYITKGLENTEWVEVIEGIEPGDEVIVSGHYSLAHDAAIRVVDPEADAESE
ncbi:MAG: efflux RND transporter periplasmic adaptor subunit [Acidobacteria bacterium]|nr:efflux RND transporter periplasmic adaptor subunit [Acidobacteriota bacterium]